MEKDFVGFAEDVRSASAVIDSTSCCFLKQNEEVLIVAKSRLLEVYDIVKDKLVLLCKYHLNGFPNNIRPIKRRKGRDHLIITFDAAKCSIVAYDEELGPFHLRTVKLYNFEETALGSNLRAKSFYSNARYNDYNLTEMKCEVAIDHRNELATVLVYNQFLAVISLKEEEEVWMSYNQSELYLEKKTELGSKNESQTVINKSNVDIDEEPKENDEVAEAIYEFEMNSNCYLIDLQDYGISCFTSIKDIRLLQDSNSATILVILHTSKRKATTGRLMVNNFTGCLTMLFVSPSKASLYRNYVNLPFNCTKIAATLSEGVVIASPTVLIFISIFDNKTYALPTTQKIDSNMIDTKVFKQYLNLSSLNLRLDSSTFSRDNFFLYIILKHGQLVTISLDFFRNIHNSSNKTDHVMFVSNTVSASCMTFFNKSECSYLFIGSKLGNNLLVKLSYEQVRSIMLKRKLMKYLVEEKNVLFLEATDTAQIGIRTKILDNSYFLQDKEVQRDYKVNLVVSDFLNCSSPSTSLEHCKMFNLENIANKIIEGGTRVFEILEQNNKHTIAATFNRTLDTLKTALEGSGSIDELENMNVTDHLEIPLALDFFKNTEYSFQPFITSYGRDFNSGIEIFEPFGMQFKLDFNRSLKIQSDIETEENFDLNFLNNFFQDKPSILFQQFHSYKKLQLYPIDPEGNRLILSNQQIGFIIENMKDISLLSLGTFDVNYTLLLKTLNNNLIIQVLTTYICFLLKDKPNQLIRTIRFKGVKSKHKAIKVELLGDRLFCLFSHGVLIKYTIDGTKLNIEYQISGVQCFSLYQQKYLCIIIYNTSLDVYQFNVVDMKTLEVKIKTKQALQSGKWSIKVETETKEVLTNHILEVNVHEDDFVTELIVKRIKGVTILVFRLSNSRVFIYTLRDKWLYRIPFNQNYYQDKSLNKNDVNSLEMKYKPTFIYFENFSGKEFIFIEQVLTKSFIIGVSKGEISCIILGLINVFALAATSDKIMYLNEKGRIFETKAFTNQYFNFHTKSTKVPLKKTVSQLISVSSLPFFAAITSINETEEEHDYAVRTTDSLTLLNFTPLFSQESEGLEINSLICDNFSLSRHEKGLCLKRLRLFGPNNEYGDFFVLGTGLLSPGAEDASCKGRIILFSLNIAEKKLNRRFVIDNPKMRGPVSAISSLSGKLVVALGSCPSQIRIFKYSPSLVNFTPLTFIDLPFFTTDLFLVNKHKSLLLATDIYESSYLIYWYDYKSTFELFVKTRNIEFKSRKRQICGKAVLFKPSISEKSRVVTFTGDNQGQIRLETFDFTRSRKRFLPVGEFNFRDEIFSMEVVDETIFVCCSSGAIYSINLIFDERMKRKLYILKAILTTLEYKNNAGLNSRGYRNSPGKIRKFKNCLDGSILKKFFGLSSAEQSKISTLIGYSVESLHNLP